MATLISRLISCSAIIAVLSPLAGAVDLRAQSTDWTAILMAPPFPSPFVSEWERNPQNLTLTVVHSALGSSDYQVEGVLREARRGEMARAESPPLRMEGVATITLTAADLADWRVRLARRADVDAAVRSGVIPEGDYEICARVLTMQRVQLAEDCARFSITLPEPPELIFPGPGDALTSGQATFQWTPVLMPPAVGTSYRLRIVPRLGNQTPHAAMQANPPHHESELSGAPFFLYPTDALPLDAGREYVWQVEALDAMGQPLLPGGLRSELWTFRPSSPTGTGTIAGAGALPDTLEIVPGVARLIGLRSVEVHETPFGLSLNGDARLEFTEPFETSARVRLQDLEVDGQGAQLRVTGGRVIGQLSADAIPENLRGRFTMLDQLEYTPGEGLLLRGRLQLPGAASGIELRGRAQVTSRGLYGVLEGEAPAGSNLMELGGDPVALRMRAARLTLPSGEVELDGVLDVFAGEGACTNVSGVLGADGVWTANALCVPDLAIPLAGAASRAEVRLHSVIGKLSVSLADAPTFDYDLEVNAGLRLDAQSGDACSASMAMRLAGGQASLTNVTPRCDATLGAAALDWLALGFGNLRVDRLGYTPGTGFDFALRVDVNPNVPGVPDLGLPTIPDVGISRAGLSLPAFDEQGIGDAIDIAGYRVRISRVSMPAFTLGWDAWQSGSAEGFAFDLELALSMPNLPAPAPACLSAGWLSPGSARLAGGELTMDLGGSGTFDAGNCTIVLAEDVAVGIERLGGTIAVRLFPELELRSGAEAFGRLTLPPLFECTTGAARQLSLSGGVFLGPRGELAGTVRGLSPECPLDFGAVQLAIRDAALEFGGTADERIVRLSGAGHARFSALENVEGSGEITVDLLTGRISDGSIAFRGPLRLDLPRDEPLLSFELAAARLDASGLHVDGRHALMLPGERINTTFDNVVFDPFELRVRDGRVLFDTPFSIDAGLAQDGSVAWRAVDSESPFTLQTGARISLPEQILLGADGFAARGAGGARLVYDGRDLNELGALFDDSFALGIDPVAVADGSVELRSDGVRIAWFDANGFHADLAYLGRGLVPDRLPLPSVELAYLQLREEDGTLNVSTEVVPDGIRVFTAPGRLAPLVLPALVEDGGAAPELAVAFDLTLDPLGESVIAGQVMAVVPEGAASPFDLSSRGIPFVINGVSYSSDGADGYRMALAGQLRLLDRTVGEPGSVVLELTPGGRLAGMFSVAGSGQYALVDGSDRLHFAIEELNGDFDIGLTDGRRVWQVAHAGTLRLALGDGEPYAIAATLAASNRGFEFTSLEDSGGAASRSFDLGGVRLGVDHVTVPRLAYSETDGWDFDIALDLSLEFPAMAGLSLPRAREIRLSPAGLTIPRLTAPELVSAPFEYAGFSLKPLAFRMDSLHLDVFGGGRPDDWGFAFDLEVALNELPDGAPAPLKGLKLTALDVGYSNGRFTGSVEPVVLAEPIALPIGTRDMAVNLLSLAGALRETSGVGAIELEAAVSWSAPEYMQCDVGGPIALGGGSVRLTSSGMVSGSATGVVPQCPLHLGPLALRATDSALEFSYEPGRDGTAELRMNAVARLPGPVDGDTISAAGQITFDLVNVGIRAGRIDVDQPFRWDLPARHPFLSFVVHGGRIDTDGLVLTGEGGLRVESDAGTATVEVGFNDLALDLASFDVSSGSIDFRNDFALDVAIENGGLTWAARPSSSPRPEQDGFRLAVPQGARFTTEGLMLEGEASAQLAFADSVYSALQVVFTDQFRIGTEPVGVRGGRAGFVHDGREIAYLDSRGFWPGDLFALMEVPARLPLPDTTVAYVQLRDVESGELLVGMTAGSDGLRLSGSGLQLVVPGLAGSGAAPRASISLDLVVNPATFSVVSGSVMAEGTDGESLFGLAERFDLPLQLLALRYADEGSGYRMTADASVLLPESLRDLPPVELRRMAVTSAGLSGEVRLGSYRSGYESGEEPLASHDFAAVGVRVDGLQAEMGEGVRRLEIAGSMTLAPFTDDDGSPTPIHFTGSAGDSGRLTFAAAVDSLVGGVLDFGAATFAPRSMDSRPGLEMMVDDDRLAVRLGGELRVPQLGDEFAVTVKSLEVGTDGVRLDEAALTGEQQFALFGATFTLKPSADGSDPALALSYSDSTRALVMTMSGELELPFLEQVPRFSGLRVSTAGSVSLAYANLLGDSLVIVENVLTLDSLTVAENRLHAALGVMLPEPLAQGGGKQNVRFSLAADGTVEGDGRVVLLDDQSDANGRDLGAATVHLRYLDLDIRSGGQSPTATLRAISDLELAGDAGNRINFGYTSGGAVYPGLTIDFRDGASWGNVRMRDSIRTPFEVMYLTLREVSMVHEPEGPSLAFGGTVGFDLPGVKGGLQFGGFRLTRDLEPDFAGIDVSGGNLDIAGVAVLELTNFAHGSRDTTIQVARIGMPTSQSANLTSGEYESVAVSSYVNLSGRIGIGCGSSGDKCVMAGGVEQVQFYRTAGSAPRTSFLVRNAELEVGSLLAMRADILYREGEGQGVELLLGADATIMSEYGATVVGLFDNTGGDVRAGMFVALQAPIPIAPPLILAEVGGGFFYNARPEHIALVRQRAGLPEGSIAAPGGKFTGLLYANAIIGDEKLASGRVLLTASEASARLQGHLILLADAGLGGEPLAQGSVDVAVGFKQKFVEGNVSLDVRYGSLVSGGGRMEFYVYGTDAWGVYGDANLQFLSLVNGRAGFFVGAPGFMVQGGLSAGFDFWIVAVRGELDAAMWYQVQPFDLGAYMRVAASASLLGGVVSAKADLKGAMLAGGGESPLIYAGALAQGCVALIGCADANIWAKFQDGRVRGGFGKDPTMSQIIERANGVLDGMSAARDEAVANVEETRPAPGSLALSDEELAEMYGQLDRQAFGIFGSPTERMVGRFIDKENQFSQYSPSWNSERGYYYWYRDILAQKNLVSPLGRLPDPDPVLEQIRQMQPAVSAQLASIRTDLLDLEQLAEEAWPESPVSSVTFERPRASLTLDADGNEVKHLDSGPGFAVDASASERARSDLTIRKERADALMQQISAQLASLESAIETVEAPFRSGSMFSTEPSIGRFALQNASALMMAEERYAKQGSYTLQRQDWFRTSLADLYARESEVRGFLAEKTRRMTPLSVRQAARDRVSALDEMMGVSGSGSRRAAFDATVNRMSDDDPWIAARANEFGMELWYELARAGMQHEDVVADSAFQAIRREANERLPAMKAQHALFTGTLHEINTRKAELIGSLYDLYDRYAFWLDGSDELDGMDVSTERSRVATRMAQLDKRLSVPKVTSANVTVENLGYMSREMMVIVATHPTDKYEYLYSSEAGGGASFLHGVGGMLTSGPLNTVFRYTLAPRSGTSSQSRTFLAGARGGAGYLGLSRTPYTLNFAPSAAGAGSVVTTHVPPDVSPPTTPRIEIRSGENWVGASQSAAWMTDGSRVEFRWSSSDPGSGVSEYEYAVGTPMDTTRIRGWTSAGGRTSIAVHGLDLIPGIANHVYVRARNGQGVVSAAGRSTAVRYDPTAPEFEEAKFRVLAVPSTAAVSELTFAELNSLATAACVIPAPAYPHQAAKSYATPSSQRGAGARQSPFITVEPPPALDSQSGVSAYYWRLDADRPAGAYTGEGWNEAEVVTFTVTGRGTFTVARPIELKDGILDFDREFHLSVVAVNGAGMASDPVVHSFRIPDPTPPLGARFCALQHSAPGQLRLAFSSAANDRESGIAGYRYRVRSDDGTVVRDWLESVDVESLKAGNDLLTSTLPLEDGASYYVDVSIRNGQGLEDVITSGPLLVDQSPPPTPGVDNIRATLDRGDGTPGELIMAQSDISFGLFVPDDPHSGLKVIQWEIHAARDSARREVTPGELSNESSVLDSRDALSTSLVAPVLAFGEILRANPGSHSIRLDLSRSLAWMQAAEPGNRYQLRVRSVNRAGLASTLHVATFTLPEPRTKSDEGTGDTGGRDTGRRNP